jgi:hypothetical protein
MPLLNQKAFVNGRCLTVYDYETYNKNRDVLKEDDQTAVDIMHNGKSTILPVRTAKKADLSEPGVYEYTDGVDFFSFPTTAEEVNTYCPDESKIIRFTDIKSMQELITKTEKFRANSNQELESPDQITRPTLKEKDTPVMRAFKEAITSKNMDLDKYKDRFGENYPNDKRKMNETDITLFMIERFAQRLDMNVDIIFSDAEGNIPNPMGKTIKVNVVPGTTETETIDNTNNEDDEDA